VTIFGSRKAYQVLGKAKASLDAAASGLRSRKGRQAREQITARDGEIAALRRELARVRGDGRLPASEDSGVFFVLGQQKSGTTWLMRILDSHPEILCKGEGRFFGRDWRQKRLKRLDAQRPPSSLYNAVLDARYLRFWIERSVWSREDDADEHLGNLTRMTIDYFLKSELSKTGKRLVGDKSPLLTPDTIREVADIYPEARVIHILRDGRDAAVSAVHHSWNFGQKGKNEEVTAKREAYRRDPGELVEAAESIFAGRSLARMAAEWAARVGRTVEEGPVLLGERYAEVRYEDLLERPHEEVRRLLGFLGADASDETVRSCVEAASFERLSKGRKRGEEDATSFFRKGVAGDWRSVFTEKDRRVFKQEAGELLVELGYEKDHDW
jgi:hypothetical protein